KEQKFLRLGIFSYSKEENTMAFDFPGKVSQKTSEKRKDELMALQESISTELLMKFIGKKIKVIIDQKSDCKDFRFEGRSYLDAPEIDGTVFISEGDIKVGDIVEVEIIDSWEYDLIGKII
ncbi:MAG: 30S ribosomal protein S12 methylthiotransferase RimO, partial [Candidatus Cloacimonetes bacterium]|nr:30S ribosomal protein S12 methylthiotransferase RimO [Candidatus Cloacimonadota bacterium]